MGDGYKAQNVSKESAVEKALGKNALSQNDPRMRELLNKVGSGGMSFQDALSQASNIKDAPSAKQQQLQAELASLQSQQKAPGKPSINGITGASNMAIGMPKMVTDSSPKMIKDPETGKDIPIQDRINAINREMETYQPTDYGTAFGDQAVMDPFTGTKLATEQVQNSPLTSGFFGQGGMQDRLFGEEQNLAGRGYQLQPEDYEAYGQASGDIARQFGQEENSISQALADRGLAAAPSGAAGVAYSGAMGNKNERLASAQRKIADDRMKMNFDRLNATRNALMQSGQLGQQALQGQYGRNLAGVQQRQGQLHDAANFAQQRGAMDQAQENTGFEQIEATKGPSFGDILGGVMTGGLGALTGGLGTGAAGAVFGGKQGAADAIAGQKKPIK